MEQNIPFVEKYRPTKMDDIVLDSYNKRIFDNILKQKIFPNLLIYGPPGTGKTTTIIAIINEYNEKIDNTNYETMHLNASDDRGIDNIRNIILKFVTTRSLFQNNHKFVILDEVDYMTDHAQLGLKILIETNIENVTFCLICNYISKLNVSLCNNFIKLQFKKMDKDKILSLLNKIINKENIKCSKKKLDNIYMLWKYDIRSMINYIQTNSRYIPNINILEQDSVKIIFNKLKDKQINVGLKYIDKISEIYNISIKEILFHLITYANQNSTDVELVHICKLIIHNTNIDENLLVRLFIIKIQSIF